MSKTCYIKNDIVLIRIHNKVKVTTQFQFAEHEITHTVGVVIGNISLTRHLGADFLAGIREFFGGEVKSYTILLDAARKKALQRIMDAAKEKNANAIVGLQITTSSIAHGVVDVLAYGTAVIIKL